MHMDDPEAFRALYTAHYPAVCRYLARRTAPDAVEDLAAETFLAATGTAWSTEHYDTSDFGGLKDGVGLAIDAGSSVAAKQMAIRALTTGYDAEIYESGGSPPSSLSDWGQPVARISDGGGSETVKLPGKAAQSFLIWITKAPTAEDDPGRYQMEISDVRILK